MGERASAALGAWYQCPQLWEEERGVLEKEGREERGEEERGGREGKKKEEAEEGVE